MNPWEKNNWYDFDSGDKPSTSNADNRSDNQKRSSVVKEMTFFVPQNVILIAQNVISRYEK